jgi:hypothetical protein
MSTTITLSWKDSALTASPTTISAPATDHVGLTWATGTGVKSIDNITAPTSSRGSLPTPTQSNGIWTGQDNMGSSSAAYTYTVTFTDTNGTTHTTDPQIINNPTGT